MSSWIVSDWHLGETRLQLMQRPFSSPEVMTRTLRDNHNALVKEDDIVYVVGDVVSKSANNPYYWLDQVRTFNGRKVLFRGNHDVIFPDKDFEDYFDQIVVEGDGVDLDILPSMDDEKTLPCWITHYPTQGKIDRFNLVGHIHSSWKVQLNMLNVGVDVHHFRPISLDSIRFYYNAICGFYDADVWVGYEPQNSIHFVDRGKKTRYFTRY